MKNTFLLLFLCSVLFQTQAQPELKLVDPMVTIYPDVNDLKAYSENYSADFPSNSTADVHILLHSSLKEQITFKAFCGTKQIPVSSFSTLLDVPVERNTGLDSRTEIYTNQPNPNVVRKAPFQVFEAIKPLKNNVVISQNPFTALRLQIPTSYFGKPGTYRCRLVCQGKDWRKTGTFSITIHPVKLPSLANQKFFYTNWFNLTQMEKNHSVERWSPAWFRMLDKYARLMAAGRQNCINIPSELLSYKNSEITLDEEKLLKFINVFRNYGFQYYESPHIMYRGDNDNWADAELKVCLTKRPYSNPQAQADVAQIVNLIKDFSIKNKLETCWLQHISDEPTKVQAACYQKVVKQVKGIYPAIKIMDATNDRDSLVGAIDYWCPLINDFQENHDFFSKRVQAGEKVLVYTCLIPGGKWLNRTLDMEHLRQVYFGWGTAKYNTMGYLHWGLNQYQVENPYKQSVVHHSAPGAGANNELPAGDTHIVYPELDGPISSVRFEAHRLGVEDYELLMKLKIKNEDKCNQLINRLFRSFADYELSNVEYRKVRKELLESL
jgi:hypothetical protein